jgi:RHS repeat-associated protein
MPRCSSTPIGLNFTYMRAVASGTLGGYSYGGAAYADPDAVTQIANGLSTSTFQYDQNGNVVQKTADGTTTTYVYDYANRLTALGVLGATTSYGYDAFGSRVLQTGTTTTYLYPFKWFSVASSTGTGAKYATTTSYMFNGDTLLATVDQQTASGTATGTAKTRYVHPDHLGSTNVVTDENDNVVQTLDYYPYGAKRISTGSTNEKRQFIGQFTDDSTLSYLNARYYNGAQGQFISQDPIFLGDPKQQTLQDPQSLNAYSYSEDNPVTKSDPTGKASALALAPAYYFAPEEVLAGPVGWGLLGLTALGTGVLIAENAPRVVPTAPGSQQVFQESIGQGYNTDPDIGGKSPPPGWGTLGKIIFWTGVGSYVGCQLVGCDLEGGTQATAKPAVSGTSQLPAPVSQNASGPIPWNNISYSRISVPSQTNYSSGSSRSTAQSSGGSSSGVSGYIAVLQQTVSLLQSIVRSYGATPVK